MSAPENVLMPKDWTELLAALMEDSWNDQIKRHRSQYAYRGLSHDYPLYTSLMRLGGNTKFIEGHLIRNFEKYAWNSGSMNYPLWHLISIAQHHGLPTRLMDWTYSPLIALHFATSNTKTFDVDGVVWKVHYGDVHSFLPEGVKRPLTESGAGIFTASMLDSSLESLSALDGLTTIKGAHAIFFEPPSLDDRIVNQFAYFSMLSDPTLGMDKWLETSSVRWKKIIISKGFKWEIRDFLDQNNITERVLFPGLDGLSSWLRRHYSPRS
jgi:FRG domain